MNEMTSAAPLTPLPSAWVEKLFERMISRYGNKFLDMWRSLDLQAVKTAWGEDLAGYSAAEIKRGLDWCKTQPWPPTLPEFMTACRPVIDSRTEWAEACEQMRIRLEGKGEDRWSRPEVYWAAVSIGWYDLNSTAWERIKTRWENALATAKTDPIPEYRAQLPAPGKQSISREEAEERVKSLNVTLGEGKTDYKAWAKRIIANPQNYPHKSLELAKEALAQEETA